MAAYYTILDHITDDSIDQMPPIQYSFASKPSDIGHIGDSDFLIKIEGKDIEEILQVMDELMATLQVINPRLYEGVMRKIAE